MAGLPGEKVGRMEEQALGSLGGEAFWAGMPLPGSRGMGRKEPLTTRNEKSWQLDETPGGDSGSFWGRGGGMTTGDAGWEGPVGVGP